MRRTSAYTTATTVVLTASVFAASAAFAATYTDPAGITYDYTPGQHFNSTVTAYSGSASDITIPRLFAAGDAQYAVTAIGNSAFYDLEGLPGGKLTSVTFQAGASPHPVTSIGASAFAENDLTEVELPANLMDIGLDAFSSNHIETLVIPNHVATIEHGAFGLNPITSLALGTSVTSISRLAFSENLLTEVDIPASVDTLGEAVFYNSDLGPSSPLVDVEFKGAAPTTFSALTEDEAFRGSLGNAADLVVTYNSKFDANNVSGENAFVAGTWMGYQTQAIPLVKVKRPKKVKDNTKFTVKVFPSKGSKTLKDGRVKISFSGSKKFKGKKKVGVKKGVAAFSFTSPNVGKKPKTVTATITYLHADGKPLTNKTVTRKITVRE